jgi:rhamnulokinase
VIGGGANNKLLNQLTADAIGMPVVAGPTEATAIGNCLVQAKAAGLVKDRWEIREVVARSFPLQVYLPKLMKS